MLQERNFFIDAYLGQKMRLQIVNAFQSAGASMEYTTVVNLKDAPNVRLELIDQVAYPIMGTCTQDGHDLRSGLSQYRINSMMHSKLAVEHAV